MTNKADSTELTILGYTSKWIEYGILSLEQLKKDLSEFRQPNSDRSTEHYRYKVLIEYVDSKREFSDDEIDRLLELLVQDTDPAMAHSFVIFDLLKRDVLTDQQFTSFKSHPLAKEADISRAYSICNLLRSLQRDGLTIKVLDRCIEEGDAKVHKMLLEYTDLPYKAILALSKSGANKAVCNIAKQRLGSKQYQETARGS